MGRTALHYATSMKGEDAEAMAAALTEAKSNVEIKDINGCDVAAVKARAIDMEEFMKTYNTNLERQSASVSL